MAQPMPVIVCSIITAVIVFLLETVCCSSITVLISGLFKYVWRSKRHQVLKC